MNGIRDLNELAADDAAVEAEIDGLSDDALIGLATYALEWDETRDAYSTDQREEQQNKRALAIPDWFLPVAAVLVAVILLAWGA